VFTLEALFYLRSSFLLPFFWNTIFKMSLILRTSFFPKYMERIVQSLNTNWAASEVQFQHECTILQQLSKENVCIVDGPQETRRYWESICRSNNINGKYLVCCEPVEVWIAIDKVQFDGSFKTYFS
jgi:hypothetical protein